MTKSSTEKSIIADRVRAARLKRKWTQHDLADQLGLHHSAISKFENKREPKLQNLISLATALGVTTDYLLGLED